MTRPGAQLPTMKPDRACPFARGISSSTATDRVAELRQGLLMLAPHAPVSVELPPDWATDPYSDANWCFQLHSLRWAQAYKRAFDMTNDGSLLHDYLAILEDWHANNPWSAPPSDESWGDHSTALRARVYAACAQAMTSPWPRWLRLALDEHVDVLSGPDLYPSGGNHALNQNVGLYAAASVLGRDEERRFAIDRTAELLERSVDEQGVTDEQSSEYQVYNFRRYREAAALFRADGTALPQVFDRLDRMPELIAHATLPNGRDVMIGDAFDEPAYRIPGTIAEYAASRATTGPVPTERVRRFDRGFVFARTGWGTERPIDDEGHLALRFGPARVPHGHHDACAVSWYAHGHRLFTSAGKYAYVSDQFRAYVLSRRAQNTVTFPGSTYGPDGGSELVAFDESDGLLVASVRDHHYPDVEFVRTVVFDLESADLVIVDRFASLDGIEITAEQRLRLHPAFDVEKAGDRGVTAAATDGPCVTIEQLGDCDGLHVACGATDPLDGWVSLRYGQREPSAVVTASRTAASGLFVTAATCTPGPASARSQPPPAVEYDAADGQVTLFGRPLPIA